MNQNKTIIPTIILIITLTAIVGIIALSKKNGHPPQFNPERAYQDVAYQVSLGPRVFNSYAHATVREYIKTELTEYGWAVQEQAHWVGELQIFNLVADKGTGATWVLIGAHYDSRLLADRDPNPKNQLQPILGANDGASGVAVLLELGRVIPENLNTRVSLVFFDAEDNGNILDYEWILGSQAYVNNLVEYPTAVIIVDMVGDRDLNLYIENNSNPALTNEIWQQASELGYSQFIPQPKHTILDDHIPFLKAGIPSIDIIDFDYPFWHTSEDTLDKISAESLDAVGSTILMWLINQDK